MLTSVARPNARFPQSIKALREKFPRGIIIQARAVLDSGDIVEFQGALDGPGGQFDRLLAALRNSEARCQQKDPATSDAS